MPCLWSWVWCASSLLLVLLSCLSSQKNFLQLELNTFLNSAIVVITGASPNKTAMPMGGKGTWRVNYAGDGFREQRQRFTQRKPMDWDWLAHYLGLHSKHSYQQGLYVEETHKGDRERVDTSAGHLPATHTPSEFSVLTSGDIQEHDLKAQCVR